MAHAGAGHQNRTQHSVLASAAAIAQQQKVTLQHRASPSPVAHSWLLRVVSAVQWHVDPAVTMYSNMVAWRKEHDVDNM
jgi:hypothetical protein